MRRSGEGLPPTSQWTGGRLEGEGKGEGKGVGKGKGKGMQGAGKGWGGGARAVPLAEFHRQVDDGRAQEWPPRGDWGQGWGAALFGGAQEMPPPITQPGPDQRGRLEATAWGEDARAQREARAREAQLQEARAAEARKAAEELDRWALARAYRWAAEQALLGRAHLRDPAHDPLDIRYTEAWLGLEGAAGP